MYILYILSYQYLKNTWVCFKIVGPPMLQFSHGASMSIEPPQPIPTGQAACQMGGPGQLQVAPIFWSDFLVGKNYGD